VTTWTDGALPASDPDAFQSVAELLSLILGATDESTLDRAATTCLSELGDITDVDVLFITVLDDNSCVTDDWHWIRPGLAASAPPVGSPLSTTFGSAMEYLRLGTTLVIDDLSCLDLAPSLRALATANGLQAMMIAPVVVGSRLLGVMGLEVFHRPRHWERSLVVQLELLAQTFVETVSRTRERRALAVANAQIKRIADHIPDGLLLLNPTGAVAWVSPSFCEMSGLSVGRIMNRAASSFFHPSHRQAIDEQVARAVRSHDARITAQFQSHTGDWRWADVMLHLAAEPDSDAPDQVVMSVCDVHERHLKEHHVVRHADLDPVTGLANRAAFERALTALAQRDDRVLVAFCDIDDFTKINDEYGHDVGDDVLRAVAAAIGNIVRGDDLVSRFGGDEFAVVVTHVDDMHAVPLGARLLGVTRDLHVAGIDVSLSVGVCGPGPSSDVSAMRQRADQAMYALKQTGRDTWVDVEWIPLA
jgi:diguanylate cyclase (GGDEF)-like protein/PAS domain S-box-containing protein